MGMTSPPTATFDLPAVVQRQALVQDRVVAPRVFPVRQIVQHVIATDQAEIVRDECPQGGDIRGVLLGGGDGLQREGC
jgi:hypothetical protein